MKVKNYLEQVEILEKCKPYCDKYKVRLAKNDLSQYVSGKVEPKQDKLSILGLALDNKKNLNDFVGCAESCVCWDDKAAIHSILTGEFSVNDIFTDDWEYPVGAFHGADGGSC